MKRHGKSAAPLLLSTVLARTVCGGGSKEAANGSERDSETVMASSAVTVSLVTEEVDDTAQKPQLIGGNGTGKGLLRAGWASALTAASCC